FATKWEGGKAYDPRRDMSNTPNAQSVRFFYDAGSATMRAFFFRKPVSPFRDHALGGEVAGWWHHRLGTGHRLLEMECAATDLEDELLREGLMIFLAQRLVALREIVA